MSGSAEQLKEEERRELESAIGLIRSEEWRSYVKFLHKRAAKLQDEVNRLIRQRKFDEAYTQLALMEDCLKTAEVFVQQIKLKKVKGN